MRIHEKGAKADRDRSVVLHSYREMCRYFHVPRSQRLTPAQVAAMPTAQLYQVSKDLYNGATIAQAQKLARKLHLPGAPESPLKRLIRSIFAPRRHSFVPAE